MSKWRLITEGIRAAWHFIRMPGKSYRGPLPAADEQLQRLAGELRQDVTRLSAEIGERNVRHRPGELAQARDFITAELSIAGYTVQPLEYEVDGATCANLEVEIAGSKKPDEIVVIGAHYDSVPNCPAANDNGSGVAALLSLARRFVGVRTDRTLRFVAFVNEESPYGHTEQMGSWGYAHRCRERDENIVAMLSLETIGYYSDEPGSQKYPPVIGRLYPSVANFIAFIGNVRNGRLVRNVVQAFRESEQFPSEGGALPEAISDIGRSDHWAFWQHNYPALMVTDTAAPFRYPYYHTHEDTVDKLNFDKMSRVVRGLHGVTRSLVTVK